MRRLSSISLAILLTLSFGLSTNASAATEPNCSEFQQRVGTCPQISGKVGHGEATLGGNQTGNDNTRNDSTGDTRDDYDPVAELPNDDDKYVISIGTDRVCNLAGRCLGDSEIVEDVAPPEGTHPITLADIASFRPAIGTNRMEPDGWMVIGLDTNFYATGNSSVKHGELLDKSAAVRFTPVGWHWDFGDGSGLDSGSPGASWQQLGLDEFAPTATSHVFAAPGSFTIVLTIDYAAEYQFDGSGWVPIAGVLPVASNPLSARAGDAQTVLVGRDCEQNQRGPGC